MAKGDLHQLKSTLFWVQCRHSSGCSGEKVADHCSGGSQLGSRTISFGDPRTNPSQQPPYPSGVLMLLGSAGLPKGLVPVTGPRKAGDKEAIAAAKPLRTPPIWTTKLAAPSTSNRLDPRLGYPDLTSQKQPVPGRNGWLMTHD